MCVCSIVYNKLILIYSKIQGKQVLASFKLFGEQIIQPEASHKKSDVKKKKRKSENVLGGQEIGLRESINISTV